MKKMADGDDAGVGESGRPGGPAAAAVRLDVADRIRHGDTGRLFLFGRPRRRDGPVHHVAAACLHHRAHRRLRHRPRTRAVAAQRRDAAPTDPRCSAVFVHFDGAPDHFFCFCFGGKQLGRTPCCAARRGPRRSC